LPRELIATHPSRTARRRSDVVHSCAGRLRRQAKPVTEEDERVFNKNRQIDPAPLAGVLLVEIASVSAGIRRLLAFGRPAEPGATADHLGGCAPPQL